VLEVIEPGLLTTVQDGGRWGFGHLGVPESGACDRHGLAVANLLVGNVPDDAGLELTLVGPTLAVHEEACLGLGGADLRATVEEPGRRTIRFSPGTSRMVRAGSVVRFPGPPAPGARAYLAVAGGIDVPEVLGSRSTCLAGGFGGLEGRPLRAGDRLAGRDPAGWALVDRAWPSSLPGRQDASSGPIAVLAGPQPERFPDGTLERFLAEEWTVSTHSDRVGVRLDPLGDPIAPRPEAAEQPSQPMTWGAIQLPPDGRPVVLLADHRTVGGYPVIAVVARVGLPIAGQLAPGDRVRFIRTSIEPAQRAAREQAAIIQRVARQLGGRVGEEGGTPGRDPV
jgi:antagonist of KipI